MSLDATYWAWHVPVKPPLKKFVLIALADVAGPTNKSNPSPKWLAERTGASREAVDSSLLALVENKLIADTGKRSGPNSDIVVWELLIQGQPKFESPKKDKPPKGIPENVIALYKMYPRHVGPQPAYRAIIKAIDKHGYENVLKGTTEFSDAFKMSGKEKERCPHPATYFNREDYLCSLEDLGYKTAKKQDGQLAPSHAPSQAQVQIYFRQKLENKDQCARFVVNFYAHWHREKWQRKGKPIEWEIEASKYIADNRQREAAGPVKFTLPPHDAPEETKHPTQQTHGESITENKKSEGAEKGQGDPGRNAPDGEGR